MSSHGGRKHPKKVVGGQSLDDGRLYKSKPPREVSVSIKTSTSVVVESGNVVSDIAREGRHAMPVAGALCTEVP